MKKLLIIPFFFFVLLLGVINVSAASDENEYDRIKDEIAGLIDSGVLPEWHLNYAADPYYQQYYTHIVANNLLESFAEMPEAQVQTCVNIDRGWGEDFRSQLFSEDKIFLENINPNESIGFYFDGEYLYFLWSSKYIPTSWLELKSITLNINGTNLVLQAGYMDNTAYTCSHTKGDPMVEMIFPVFYPESNLQINVTPIAFYHECDGEIIIGGLTYDKPEYNLFDMTTFEVVSWEVQTIEGAYKEFVMECHKTRTFDLIVKPEYNGQNILTHTYYKYIDINEVKVEEGLDKYSIIFDYPYEHSTINTVYCISKFKDSNGKMSEVLFRRSSSEIGMYNLNGKQYLEVDKSLYGDILEIGFFRISFFDNTSSKEITNYDTVTSIGNTQSKNQERFIEYYDTFWTYESYTPDEDNTNEDNTNGENTNNPDNDDIVDKPSNDNTGTDNNGLNENQNNNNDNKNDLIIDDNGSILNPDKIEEELNNFFNNPDDSKLDKALKVSMSLLFGLVLIFVFYKAIKFVLKVFK